MTTDHRHRPPGAVVLAPRVRQTLQFTAWGWTTRRIAEEDGAAYSTIATYLTRAQGLLDLEGSTVPELIAACYRLGVLPAPVPDAGVTVTADGPGRRLLTLTARGGDPLTGAGAGAGCGTAAKRRALRDTMAALLDLLGARTPAHAVTRLRQLTPAADGDALDARRRLLREHLLPAQAADDARILTLTSGPFTGRWLAAPVSGPRTHGRLTLHTRAHAETLLTQIQHGSGFPHARILAPDRTGDGRWHLVWGYGPLPHSDPAARLGCTPAGAAAHLRTHDFHQRTLRAPLLDPRRRAA
ncbi:hypothetical protein ACIQXD_33245 [Streptomyces uncialis]|uniref:hypothetical protein n=1 Tax=Streptomyces uncialis TaxID=1048205 RepID=UPI0038009203